MVIRGKKLIAAFPMRFVESSVGQIGRGVEGSEVVEFERFGRGDVGW